MTKKRKWIEVIVGGKKKKLYPRESTKKRKINVVIDSNISGWTCQCGEYVPYGVNHQCPETEGDSLLISGTTDGHICPMCQRHVPNGETCKNTDMH